MKTRSFLMAVAMATMAFTLSACSSDKEEGGLKVACQSPLEIPGHYLCIEWPNEVEWEDYNIRGCENDEDFPGGTIKDKCPKGENLKCNGEAVGFKEEITAYFYGQLFEGETCESVNGSDDDDD